MIYRAAHKMVQQGRKRTIRRIPKDSYRHRVKNGRTQVVKPQRLAPGDTFRLERYQGDDGAFRLEVLSCHREPHCLVFDDPASLLLEGFESEQAYIAAWLAEYDREWMEGAEERAEGFTEEHRDRWEQKWALNPVEVIAFKVSQDVPRLLTPAAMPKHTELGYTTQASAAMPQEPEAVDEWTQRDLTQQAVQRAEFRRWERQALQIEDRMKAAHEAARRRKVDVSNEFHALRQMRQRGRQGAVVKQLVRIEDKAYGKAA